MAWRVEYTDEFEQWWDCLERDVQTRIDAIVRILRAAGPQLPFPLSSGIKRSRHTHMRELRIQHRGKPYRVLYAFDPRRVAILLLGGTKAGDDRWYEAMVPIADRLYDEHLRALNQEDNLHG